MDARAGTIEARYSGKFTSTYQPREQGALSVGRETNGDFLAFKQKFLDSLDTLRERLMSVYSVRTMDLDDLYNVTVSIFSDVQNKINAFIYLNAIYTSEYYIVEHSMRVGLLANIFSGWLGLDESRTRDATVAGFLHDIGMIEVPRAIIEKEGKLSQEEFAIIKSHISRGSVLLTNKGVKKGILDAVYSHHERFDGSGYPNGRKGDEIGFMASLISIIDVYDSMTSNRSYRSATCPFDVIEQMEKDMIHKFNPGMLYVFLEHIPYIYKGSLVKLSNGDKAKVMFINKNSKTSPIVMLEKDGSVIDLHTQKDLKILKLL